MTQTPALKTQRLRVGGMDCTSCAGKIEARLQKLAGVADVAVNVATERMIVSYDPQQIGEAAIKTEIMALGYTVHPDQAALASLELMVGGMDCASCVAKISNSLEALPGVEEATVNFSTGKLRVAYHASQVDAQTIRDRLHSLGYTAITPANPAGGPMPEQALQAGAKFSLKRALPSVVVVVVLFLVGLIFEEPLHNTPFHLGEYAVFIPAYLLSGWTVLKTAGRNILRGQVFDENFLMTVATVGAIAVHKLPEAVGVMLFYKIGELFQEGAVSRSRRSIQSLLDIRPDVANVKTADGVTAIAPDAVRVGDEILVRPGERIPLDGEVLEGTSLLDTSALTGESVPRTVRPEETVLAGMINQSGLLTVRVTKPFSESSLNRILDLIENASAKKAKTEKFITRFAQRYTPVVVLLSLAIALLPPLLLPGATHAEWVYRALVLLVISCPCGLVISIPLGYFGGIGGAAKRGILVKGSTFLDTLAAVKTVVFDKTGTLTQGVFNVTDIVPANGLTPDHLTPDQLLALAAQVEAHSNHPVAQSIRAAYGKPIDASSVQDYREVPGHGIQAIVGGRTVLAGNDRFLHREAIAHDCCDVGGTVLHLAVEGKYAGYITIADQLKSDAVDAIQALHATGVERTWMLTGDNEAVARAIAHQLGVDNVLAGLLPEDKVNALERILAQEPSGKVAFVGDGINDAPVIARADVGLAMGGLGSDAAIETADVVLMTDAPSKVAEAIQVARKTLRIVWQNIIFAMAIKGLFIILGILGVATMWEAVFADMGVALLAILNALRVMR